MMDDKLFDQWLETISRRVELLSRHSTSTPEPQASAPLLTKPFAELSTTLKQLDLAAAELRRQNDEFIATRQALRRSEQEFRAIFELNAVGMAQSDPTGGRFTRVNHKLSDISGYSETELLGMTCLQLTHPDDRELDTARVQAALRGETEGWTSEKRYIRKDGECIWVEVVGTVIRNGAGQPLCTVGIIQDISKRKQTEQELEQHVAERTADLHLEIQERQRAEEAVVTERRRLEDILNILPAYLVLLTPDYHVPFANKFFRERFGAAQGRRCFEYLFNRTEPCEVCETFKVLQTMAPLQWEWTGPDGRNYDIYDFPFPDADGSTLIMEVGIDITARKQAEATLKEVNEKLEQRVAERTAELAQSNTHLRQSEARFLSLYTSMTEGMALHQIIYNAEGQALDYELLDVNPAFEAITGLSKAQVVGRKASVLYGSGRPPYFEIYSQVAASGEPAAFETYFGPMEKHFNISVFSPAPGQFGTIFTDITWRKQAEEELAQANEELQVQNEELQIQADELAAQAEELQAQAIQLEAERTRLRAIIDNAPDAILVADENGQVVLANPAAQRLYPQVPGLDDLVQTVRYYPDHQTPYELDELPLFRAAVYKETNHNIPIALQESDGRWHNILASAVPILDSRGQAHGAVGVYQDITEIKQTEEALRVALEKYRVLFESFPLGITVSDETGKIVESNKEAERLLSVPPTEHSQRDIDSPEWQIVRPDGSLMPAEEYASVRALQENRLVDNVEMGIVQEAGQITWINVTAAPIPVEGYGVAVAYGDVTARKQAETQIKAALAEKEVLLQEIHHRVKNNLQVLMHLIDMQTETMQNPEVIQMFRALQQRIQSMALIHARLYQSQDLGRVDFGDYLRNLTTYLYESLAGHRNIALSVETDEVFINLNMANPCGLIVNELVTNALKYAFPEERAAGDEIKVEFRLKEDEYVLTVSDNGVGLPPGLDWRNTESLGLKLVDILANYQLQGRVEVSTWPYSTPGGTDSRNGTAFTIRFAEKGK